MATACLRLVTFLPERPLRSVPRFRSFIARFTARFARGPYFLVIAFPCEWIRALRHEDGRRNVVRAAVTR